MTRTRRFVLIGSLLIAVAGAGCRSAEPEPAEAAWEIDPARQPDARAPIARAPGEGQSTEELIDAMSLQSQERKARAARELELGLEAYEQLDYERAEKHFAAAVEAWPASESAILYLEKTQRIRGTRDDVWTGSVDRLARERQVHVQERQAEAERLYRQGLQHHNAGDFERAVARFEQVLELAAWMLYHVDPTGSLVARAQRKLDRAREGKRETDVEARERREQQAYDRAQVEAKRDLQLRRDRLRYLIRQANDSLQLGRFRRAQELAEEALRIEQNNSEAYRIRQEAIRRRHQKERSSSSSLNREQERLDREATDEVAIPYALGGSGRSFEAGGASLTQVVPQRARCGIACAA